MSEKQRKTFSPQKNHRKQMLLQIWLPLTLAVGIFASLTVLVILSAEKSSPVIGQAANVSMIFLIAPLIVMGLLYAFLLGSSIYLVAKLSGKIPSVTRPVQAFLEVARLKTDQVTSAAARPIIKFGSFMAAVRRLIHRH